MTRIITLDCEFVPNRLDPAGLVSIGLTDGTNHFYGVNADTDFDAVTAWKFPWMRDNVVRHLPLHEDGTLDLGHPHVLPYTVLRERVAEFFERGGHRRNQILHMNCGAQDMLRLHTFWDNDWSDMPDCVPHSFEDMQNVFRRFDVDEDDLPQIDPAHQHHAFHDAAHDMLLLRHLKVYEELAA